MTIPPPGAHGGDGPAIARALGLDVTSLLDLSQTLNPFAPNIVEIAATQLGSLTSYPDARRPETLLAEIERATSLANKVEWLLFGALSGLALFDMFRQTP